MKKTYIIPKIHITEVRCEAMIAQSRMGKYSNGGTDEVLVKGESSSSSTSRYNVWDDDWSAE